MRKLLKYSWPIIALCVAVTGFFGYYIKDIRLENTLRQFFPREHESYTRLLDTEEEFGSMTSVGITLETPDDSIITPEIISAVDRITQRVEALDNVEDIDSITNIDYIYGEDGALIAGSLIPDDYAGTPADIELIRRKVIDWDDMYNRVIISDNGKATQLAITLNPQASVPETQVVLDELRKIVSEELTDPRISVIYYGDPVMSENSKTFMLEDLFRLIPLVVVVVLISLALSFGTWDGMILPLITVLMSTVWSCGIMAMQGIIFTLISSAIPVALIACGSAYGIHVLTHYYIALEAVEGEMTREKHLGAIIAGLADVRKAVLMAGITTIAGFISLVSSPIVPLHSFAVFTALGVLFSLVLSVVLIPAILYVKPVHTVGRKSRAMAKITGAAKEKILSRQEKRKAKSEKTASGTADTLYTLYRFFAGTRPRMIVFSLLILVLSAAGIKKLVVDTALVNYFPEDSQFRKDLKRVDERLAGTNSVYLLVSGEEKGCMTNPEILKAMDNLQAYLLETHPEIGKAVSFTTFLKRMNQVMHVPSADTVVRPDAPEDGAGGGFGGDGFSDFGDFGDFGAEAAAPAGDGFSDFSDFGAFETENTAGGSQTPATEPASSFIDPNIAYSEALSSTYTLQEMLMMIHNAYAAAGGKNASVEEVVRSIERQYNFNGLDYYEVPYDVSKYPSETREQLGNLVAQYLMLFSGSLDKFNDDPNDPKMCRMQLQLRTHSTTYTEKIVEDAMAYAKRYFPDGYKLEATGNGEMECVMTELVVSSQIYSLVFSLACVFVILSVVFRSGWAGLVGAIPLAFTILLNYMLMGLTGIHLDFVTSIIASVAVGVGIDYTIHFITTYREERLQSDDLDEVARNTFRKSGIGIITNAIAVGLGFLVLCLSNFTALVYIGILVAIVMFTSSGLAMTIIPGLLRAFDPKFIRGGRERQEA